MGNVRTTFTKRRSLRATPSITRISIEQRILLIFKGNNVEKISVFLLYFPFAGSDGVKANKKFLSPFCFVAIVIIL